MKFINKNILMISVFNSFFFIQKARAEFQEISKVKKSPSDLPAANFVNNSLEYANVGLAVIFIVFSLLLIASGIEFLVAGGDEGSLETGHRMWRLALLGMSSSLLAYIILNLIKYFI